MDTYSVGGSFRLTATFRNIAGTLTDPTSIELKIETPAGVESTFDDGDMTSDSTGIWYYDVELTESGTWSFHVDADGDVDAAYDDQVYVKRSTFETNLNGWNELRERVYAVVRDSNRNFVPEDSVDIWLREGLEDLSSRLKLDQTAVESTTSGNTITLPTDYVDMVWLKVTKTGSSNDYVAWVDDDVWNSYEENASTPHHTLGRIFNGTIELYPTPDTGTAYELRYWNSANADTSILTGPLKTKLVNYARAHASLHTGDDPAKFESYMAMYERGLPAPRVTNRNKIPGPLSIYPVGNWFESSAYRD